MGVEEIRRRGFLGAMTASVVGVAGCESLESGDGAKTGPDHTTKNEANQAAAQPNGDISHQRPSYIIYNRDGQTRAFDTATQTERFRGSPASEVIQSAISDLDAGAIYIIAGEYEIGAKGIRLQSNIRIVGEGRGATILKLRDGINGRRGEIASKVLSVGQNVENVTIADLEIDGNESGNRDVPPYPMSPHHHGIVIHGDEAQVPEDEKPANVTVRNVSVHDTVRSNIVLAGRNCELHNLWLANSATDHWLYLGGATNCNISGVHASGFARTSGIVFGVGERRAYGTTLSDVTISNLARTPYPNEQGPGFAGEYPVRAITMRKSSGNAHDNTVRNLRIRIPDAESGSAIAILESNTRLQNLTYRGPTAQGGILTMDPAAEETSVTGADILITKDGRGEMRGIISMTAPDVTLSDVRIDAAGIGESPGIYIAEGPRPTARAVLRDVRVSSAGPALRVNRGEYGVPGLVVDSLFDRKDRGIVGVEDIDPKRMEVYS